MLSLLFTVALFCLLYLGWSDLRTRLLPNKWVLAYALLLIPTLFLRQPDWAQLGGHLGVGIIAFFVFLLLFIANAMGGGDVKLGAAVFLWAGSANWLPVLLITAWVGGGLAILGWLLDRRVLQGIRCSAFVALRYGLSAQRGVPYGVGLVVAGIFVLWRYWHEWPI